MFNALPSALRISIHAPSRERPNVNSSTGQVLDFNPRSLAGATYDKLYDAINHDISIHAPSRERPGYNLFRSPTLEFQSTLPRGSDADNAKAAIIDIISIHAPSRERPSGTEDN